MVMPARSFTASGNYRYGFNGKGKDNNINSLTDYDYGFRIYNPAIGKFLSVDPLTQKYPYYSPYHFAGNKPIKCIDLDGTEPEDRVENWQGRQMIINGTRKVDDEVELDSYFGSMSYRAVYDKVSNQYWFVMNRDGSYYYWKHKDGADRHSLIQSNMPGNDNGSWATFETANEIDAKAGEASADFLEKFFVGIFVAPFGIEATAAAGTDYLLTKTVEAGSDALGQYVATGKVDWFDVGTDLLPVKTKLAKVGLRLFQSSVDITSDGVKIAGINKKWSDVSIDLGTSFGGDALKNLASKSKYVKALSPDIKGKIFKSFVQGQLNFLQSAVQTKTGEKAKEIIQKQE